MFKKPTLVVLILFSLFNSLFSQDYPLPHFSGQMIIVEGNQKGKILEQRIPERINKSSDKLKITEPFSSIRISEAKYPSFLIQLKDISDINSSVSLYKILNYGKNRIFSEIEEFKIKLILENYRDDLYIIKIDEELEIGSEYLFKIKNIKAVSCFGVGKDSKKGTKEEALEIENVFVQSVFSKGDKFIFLGLGNSKPFFPFGPNRNSRNNFGLGSSSNTFNAKSSMFNLSIGYELAVTDFLGIAPHAGFGFKSDRSKESKPRNTFTHFGADINFHFYSLIGSKSLIDIKQDKLDMYLGVGLVGGIETEYFKERLFPSNEFESNRNINARAAWGLHYGIRYFPIENFGILGEIGYRKRFVTLGVVYKPSPKSKKSSSSSKQYTPKALSENVTSPKEESKTDKIILNSGIEIDGEMILEGVPKENDILKYKTSSGETKSIKMQEVSKLIFSDGSVLYDVEKLQKEKIIDDKEIQYDKIILKSGEEINGELLIEGVPRENDLLKYKTPSGQMKAIDMQNVEKLVYPDGSVLYEEKKEQKIESKKEYDEILLKSGEVIDAELLLNGIPQKNDIIQYKNIEGNTKSLDMMYVSKLTFANGNVIYRSIEDDNQLDKKEYDKIILKSGEEIIGKMLINSVPKENDLLRYQTTTGAVKSISMQNVEKLLYSDGSILYEVERVKLVTCPSCKGEGHTFQESNAICKAEGCDKGKVPCDLCDGTGRGASKGNKFNPATNTVEPIFEECSKCKGSTKTTCENCNGKGIALQKNKKTCSVCNGVGTIKE